NGGLSLLLAILMLANVLQLWMAIVLVALHALFSAFHFSAFDSSYAMIVPEKQLPRANGMMQTMWALSGILSPGIAAMIISLPTLARQGVIVGDLGVGLARFSDGTPLAITLDAITFFFAAVVLLFVVIPSPRRADLHATDGSRKSIWADVKEGALYIGHRRPLLWLLGTFAVANFVGGPLNVLMPLVVKFNLSPDWSARGFTFETAFALLGTIGSIGGVAGGLLISVWGGLKKRRVYGVVVAMIFQGLTMIVFGGSPWLYLTAMAALVGHAMMPISNAHSQAIWQTQTPRELQGRVFAVRRLIAQFSWPLSAALAGLIGGLFDPGAVVAILGGILTLFCIAQLFNPYLLRVEDKAYLDQMAAQKMIPVEAK
ncbi:MAG: MFS transporter, partial [Chloroflexota bacterium]